jgi:hypothetical protein
MAVQDLIEPSGEIPADLFGESTEANVVTWYYRAVRQAAAVAAGLRDLATAEYAYYLAFSAKARQLASLPASYSEDGNSIQHTAQQAQFFQKLADAHLAQFNTYQASGDDAPLPPSRPLSSSVQTVVVF